MTGIFGALDIARKGLIVSQSGINNAGHNIANANTPGYSQQRVRQSAEVPLLKGGNLIGQGVRFRGIERITDPFVESQLIRQSGTAAATREQSAVLSLVERECDHTTVLTQKETRRVQGATRWHRPVTCLQKEEKSR